MENNQKLGRYQRIYSQLKDITGKVSDPVSRMATIAAVLHNKFDHFYWTGFYLLRDGELLVGPYQGTVACVRLEKKKGVCWAGINSGSPVIVPNVEEFEGHIACDSRSKSEIVIPLRNRKNEILGVLDIDSRSLNSFNDVDKQGLEQIAGLIYN
ncbi:MAG: GAF domain-containing protein [Bacteroidota bacterium]